MKKSTHPKVHLCVEARYVDTRQMLSHAVEKAINDMRSKIEDSIEYTQAMVCDPKLHELIVSIPSQRNVGDWSEDAAKFQRPRMVCATEAGTDHSQCTPEYGAKSLVSHGIAAVFLLNPFINWKWPTEPTANDDESFVAFSSVLETQGFRGTMVFTPSLPLYPEINSGLTSLLNYLHSPKNSDTKIDPGVSQATDLEPNYRPL